MNAPENHAAPGDDTTRVWKWRVARQWRSDRRAAIVQIIAMAVGFTIWSTMLAQPDKNPVTAVLLVFLGVLLVFVSWFLFGPYKATRKIDRQRPSR